MKIITDDQNVGVAYCHSNMAKFCRFYICESKKNGLWSWDLWKNDLSRLATGNCLHVYSVQIIKTIVEKLYWRIQTFAILNIMEIQIILRLFLVIDMYCQTSSSQFFSITQPLTLLAGWEEAYLGTSVGSNLLETTYILFELP